MRVSSDAFADQKAIPIRYTKDGENVSPPIRWADLPEGTRELALVFEDITPQTRAPFVQWLVYRIPPDLEELPAGFRHRAEPEAPAAVVQGRNGIGNVGYDGPLGTAGRTVRYRFRLLALDRPLEAPPGLAKEALFKALAGHVLDEAALDVTHERPR